MKQRLKVILLNQYIGAIAIGYLVARGVEAFLGAFMPAFNSLLTQWLTGTSITKDYWVTVRGMLISNLVLTGVYFLIAYKFGLWLYDQPVASPSSEVTDDLS